MRARRRAAGRRDGRFFERAIGLALVAALTAACAAATAPVAVPLLWGVVIAVATWPAYRRLRDALGGRPRLAAALVASLLLLTLAAPVVALSLSLAGYARALGPALDRLGHAGPPAPPAWLAGLPAVGPPLDGLWREATADLGALLGHLQPYLARATGWLLARGADLGLALLQFLAAVLVAAVLQATGEPAVAFLARLSAASAASARRPCWTWSAAPCAAWRSAWSAPPSSRARSPASACCSRAPRPRCRWPSPRSPSRSSSSRRPRCCWRPPPGCSGTGGSGRRCSWRSGACWSSARSTTWSGRS